MFITKKTLTTADTATSTANKTKTKGKRHQ